VSDSPIEDYLDDLLRGLRTDARTTRRLLAEAADHLYATASELREQGLPQPRAEAEAVRRFGPIAPIVRATTRRSLANLIFETTRGAVFLGACGLIAVGISGLVALVMNIAVGRSFVGGVTTFPGQGPGPSVNEVADDAVVLRVIAGVVGLFVLLSYLAWQRRGSRLRVLPAGLIDALGAAAFAAATIGLTIAASNQAAQTGTPGVGFAVSGAVVALPATAYFCHRSARNFLRSSPATL
jgi:hypothetical protein